MTIPANARRDQPPPWLDTATLAWHLCISTETVPNWVASGILPQPYRHGGKLMWKWSEVDAYLSRREQDDAEARRIAMWVKKEREADRAASH